MSSHREPDVSLVAGVLAGDSAAVARFLDLASPLLWSIVQKLEPGADAESAFLQIFEAMKADGYAKLRAFDGRAKLSTYLTLVARDVLSRRLATRLAGAPRSAWRAFEQFFAADIRRRIAQRLPREEATWEDMYQDICLKLVEDDFRRVRAYDGRGSFIGYVLTVVDRILIDEVRRRVPRRRLPTSVSRLPCLDRAIYIAVVWERCPADAKRLAKVLDGRIDPVPASVEIVAALQRLEAMAVLGRNDAISGGHDPVPFDGAAEQSGTMIAEASPNPEERLLLEEEERSRNELVAAIQAAAKDLTAEERCYLQTVFAASEPLPPREIAKIMGCTAQDVYRLGQRVRRWMAQIADELSSASRPSKRDGGDRNHGTASIEAA